MTIIPYHCYIDSMVQVYFIDYKIEVDIDKR